MCRYHHARRLRNGEVGNRLSCEGLDGGEVGSDHPLIKALKLPIIQVTAKAVSGRFLWALRTKFQDLCFRFKKS